MKARSLWPKRRVPARKRPRATQSRRDRSAIRQKMAERLAAFRRPKVETLSEIIAETTAGQPDQMTVGALSERLSARGLAPVVLLMGILNAFAVIPGTSTILGLPLVFLGLSLIAGARRLWLPRRLREQQFSRAALDAAIQRALPYIRRAERFVRPRYWPGGEAVLYRIYGLIVLVAGLIIILPIPFGNLLPAMTVALISVGFIERDGLWVLGGLLVGVLATGVIATLATNAIGYAWGRVFG